MSKLFSPREVQKYHIIDDVTKLFFCWKSTQNLQSFHGQSVEHGQLDYNKFAIEKPGMCGHVTGSSKILNDFLAQSKGWKSQRGTKNAHFSDVFDCLGTQFQSPLKLTQKK